MSVIYSIFMVTMTVASIICWLATTVKIFKNNLLLGVLALFCPPFAFVYGWKKASQFQHKDIMMAWTVILVLSFGIGAINVVGSAMAAATG